MLLLASMDENSFEKMASLRIVNSPFANQNRRHNIGSFGSVSAASNPYQMNNSSSLTKLDAELGIHPYEKSLSSIFSKILKLTVSKYGKFKLPLITSLGSNDKFAMLVFQTCVECMAHLLPSTFSRNQFIDVLCAASLHQNSDIRNSSWKSLLSLMEYRVSMRATIIHRFTSMVLSVNDADTELQEQVVKKLMLLLQRWEKIMQTDLDNEQKHQDQPMKPTLYGVYISDFFCFKRLLLF
jgi:hypothetical protein